MPCIACIHAYVAHDIILIRTDIMDEWINTSDGMISSAGDSPYNIAVM